MAAFKASKVRARKAPMPVGRGKPITPSVAIESWYEKQLSGMTKAMIRDYKEKLSEAMKAPEVQKQFAQDASATSIFTSVLNLLRRRWDNIFENFASQLSPEFVEKTEEAATSQTLFSLRAAGVNQPKATYNEGVQHILQSSIDYNHTLITGIGQEVHEKIYDSVMLSLTSPDPEQQGMTGITNALREVGGFSEKRIKLITKDQTSKMYSSLTADRMAENGVEEFEWLHSSAGKVPRHSHVEKNGQIFKINDPRLWEGPKSDQGPPGWAINCRCRAIPVIR